MQVTELEMLEAEKYWCENCCNWDKEQVRMDGYANCKLTGTLCFAQESGKACKCFNVPAENVIVPPCKVGDKVYFVFEGDVLSDEITLIEVTESAIYLSTCSERYMLINGYLYSEMLDEKAYFTKEEAMEALGGVQG